MLKYTTTGGLVWWLCYNHAKSAYGSNFTTSCKKSNDKRRRESFECCHIFVSGYKIESDTLNSESLFATWHRAMNVRDAIEGKGG